MESANTQQSDFDPSRAVARYPPSNEEQKVQASAMSDGDDDNKRKMVVKSDGNFVALDIAQLVAATDQWDPTASPRVPKLVMKSLSRNGSQRSGGGGEEVQPSPSPPPPPPQVGPAEGISCLHRHTWPSKGSHRCRQRQMQASGRRPASLPLSRPQKSPIRLRLLVLHGNTDTTLFHPLHGRGG